MILQFRITAPDYFSRKYKLMSDETDRNILARDVSVCTLIKKHTLWCSQTSDKSQNTETVSKGFLRVTLACASPHITSYTHTHPARLLPVEVWQETTQFDWQLHDRCSSDDSCSGSISTTVVINMVVLSASIVAIATAVIVLVFFPQKFTRSHRLHHSSLFSCKTNTLIKNTDIIIKQKFHLCAACFIERAQCCLLWWRGK